MQSVTEIQEQFTTIEANNIQRSTFDRSFGHKTTLNAGELIPIFIEEALPGDTFQIQPTIFGRMETLLKPIMDNIFVDVHFFSVPLRLVWDNFKPFMGETKNPTDTTDFLLPHMSPPTGGYQELSVFDYAGIPTKVEDFTHVSYPFRAMNLIWNTWYRDQNLQDSLTVKTDDTPDDPTLYPLLKRGKRKDYFTSALPWAQKGNPVEMPLLGQAPVFGHKGGTGDHIWNVSSNTSVNKGHFMRTLSQDVSTVPYNGTTSGYLRLGFKEQYEYDPVQIPPYADLTEASSFTINQMRQAITMQQYLELDARGGTRYIEKIKSHFNVTSPDARLQYPEFLGERSVQLNVSPIAQQSASTDTSTPQGNLSAIGTFSSSGNDYIKTFTEHEIVIGFVSVRADLNYQQGLNRMWSRKTVYDLYWPTFAHLGEQAILNKEIFTSGTSTDDEVFGYQERYAEYRYKPSMVTGLYRSNATQSLDIWHLAQDFTTTPSLNSSFIEENPPIDRIIATPDEPQFLIDTFFDFKATRAMPVNATPGLKIL